MVLSRLGLAVVMMGSLLLAPTRAAADEVTVYSTGVPATDRQNLVAAVTGIPPEGRTIVLENGAGTEGFVLGSTASDQVVMGTRASPIDQSVTIRGRPDALGRMARITGGREVVVARMRP